MHTERKHTTNQVLLHDKNVYVEQRLQLFIGVIDAQLLEGVDNKDFEAEYVQNSDEPCMKHPQGGLFERLSNAYNYNKSTMTVVTATGVPVLSLYTVSDSFTIATIQENTFS